MCVCRLYICEPDVLNKEDKLSLYIRVGFCGPVYVWTLREQGLEKDNLWCDYVEVAMMHICHFYYLTLLPIRM